MPRGDRTGPLGEGPMTGRQLGYGAGYDSPGFTKSPGRGMGRGFFNRSRGRNFWRAEGSYFQEDMPVSSQRNDELSSLKSDVQQLKESISSVLDQLKMLKPEKEK